MVEGVRESAPAPVRSGGARHRHGHGLEADVEQVLAGTEAPRLVYQPIVDTVRGTVAGYEALARFGTEPDVSPEEWFCTADELGVGAELEARVLRVALARLRRLPPNTFLSVNVSPHLLDAPQVREVLEGSASLSRLVLELTEHEHRGDDGRLVRTVQRLRRRGAMFAVDDAGTGHSNLGQIALVRPEMVKIDRSLVEHVDTDETRLALVELLGEFAGRIDAWLVAEGVEREAELVAFARLGVPLAQGFLFAPGAEVPGGLPDRVVELVRRCGGLRRRSSDEVATVVDVVPTVVEGMPVIGGAAGGGSPDLPYVMVDPSGCPVELLLPSPAGLRLRPVSLRVHQESSIVETAQRALTRPARFRFDPVVCVDDTGRLVGLVRFERIVQRLAAAAGAAGKG